MKGSGEMEQSQGAWREKGEGGEQGGWGEGEGTGGGADREAEKSVGRGQGGCRSTGEWG